MSQINAPILSYENGHKIPNPYYQTQYKIFGNFSTTNGASYNDSKLFFNLPQSHENNLFCLFTENLAVQPSSEGVLSLGGLMPACRPEALPEGLQLCNLEYNQWGKQAEYFDQQMGTGHPMWRNKDVKLMKVCTLIYNK